METDSETITELIPQEPAPAKPPRQKRQVGKTILAILWLLVGIAVAAALVKFAFFSGSGTDEVTPTGSLEPPTIAVSRGSIVNEFTVSGSVTADPGVPQRATDQGTVTVTFVKVGDQIQNGQPLFEVREEIGQTEPQPIGDPDPTTGEYTQMSEPEPIYAYHEINATASGVLTKFTPLPKMQVGVGEEIGEIGPGTFTVVANISADQQFRMLDQPSEATVSISGGPAPFACDSLDIGAADEDAQAPDPVVDPGYMYGGYMGDYGAPVDDGSSQITGQIRCSVPDGQKVFAGLSADVSVVSGSADDVLLLPVTAVRGDYATGLVYVPSDGGDPVETTVELGLTDGMMIEIKAGINEGDIVLEYVPSEVPLYQEGGIIE